MFRRLALITSGFGFITALNYQDRTCRNSYFTNLIQGKFQSSCERNLNSKASMLDFSGKVIMVTGGAGFLGQHIIRVLQERTTGLREIRTFDMKDYEKKLKYQAKVPVTSFTGDIRNKDDVRKALHGVDFVIHTAGVISFGTFPDEELMQDVNVNGTLTLVDGCVEEGVCGLVHTSTVDVVIGYEPIRDGDESLPIPQKFLFSGYPVSKHGSERVVLGANGKLIQKRGNFDRLSTVSLRPNVMYGELDPYYITTGLKSAAKNGGQLVRVGNGLALFQQAYAGNVAWAHVLALHSLDMQPKGGQSAAGQAFFITDDTPLCNSFTFMEPFLEARGFSLTSYSIPYSVMYAAFYVTEAFLKLIKPLCRVNLDANLASLIYINTDIYFKHSKATKIFNYRPIYDFEESVDLSMEFYKSMDLQNE